MNPNDTSKLLFPKIMRIGLILVFLLTSCAAPEALRCILSGGDESDG
jgi:hypothetical protein